MRILIYMSGGFDVNGPSNHLYIALIIDLIKRGHSVCLIQRYSYGNEPEIPEVLSNLEGFYYKKINVKRVKKSKFIIRYLKSVIYSFKSIKYLKKFSYCDLVFVQSCPTAPFQVKFAKKYVNKPVIYNIQDMFPGSSIASGVMKSKFLKLFFFWFQKKAYRLADHITVISDDMKKKVIEQGIQYNKISTIVNWYDDENVKEIEWNDNIFVKKYGLNQDHFYIQYAGTMGYVFDYNAIIYVAEKLLAYTNIEFHMIGEGSQKNNFKIEVETKNLSNIKFYPYEPQSIISHVYSASTLCLIPLKKGVIGNSVPSKAALIMGCKRPIINSVDKDTDYYNMFDINNIGYSISNMDYEKLYETILKLYYNRSELNILGQNAYEFASKNYSRTLVTKKYIALFERVFEENKGVLSNV